MGPVRLTDFGSSSTALAQRDPALHRRILRLRTDFTAPMTTKENLHSISTRREARAA